MLAALTPNLQFQYAAGKNTSDIALALDALEALFDSRAETFCIVTSDSDFAHLCRKLRERGATVLIVGEEKTPAALRNASDQFFEWTKPSPLQAEISRSSSGIAPILATPKTESVKAEIAKPIPKRRPRSVVEAVNLLAADTSEGTVALGPLGQYLKRADPAFSPKTYGHSGLLDMLRTYDLLTVMQEPSGQWLVKMNSAMEQAAGVNGVPAGSAPG